MLLTKLKVATAVFVVAGVLSVGAVGVNRPGRADGAGGGPGPGGTKQEPLYRVKFVDAGTVERPARADKKEDVWTLDFAFHDPEFRGVSGPKGGKRTVLCFRYEVWNQTGRPRHFIPVFRLQEGPGRPSVQDRVLPGAAERIARAEDPAGQLHLLDSVAIAREPIPVFRPGGPRRGVHGVALWDGVDTDIDHFSIFVDGLTNAWSATDPDTLVPRHLVRRMALRLDFKRGPRGRIVFVPPRQWVYGGLRLGEVNGDAPDLRGAQERGGALQRRGELFYTKDAIITIEQKRQLWHKARDDIESILRQCHKLVELDPQDANSDRAKDQQAVLQALQRLLKSGDQDDARWREDLHLLRERLKALEKPSAQATAPREVRGTVEEVDGYLLLLSLGADHAVRKGDRLEVYRLRPRPLYLGQVEVVEVIGARAVARVLRPQAGQGPRAGDQVARSLK